MHLSAIKSFKESETKWSKCRSWLQIEGWYLLEAAEKQIKYSGNTGIYAVLHKGDHKGCNCSFNEGPECAYFMEEDRKNK